MLNGGEVIVEYLAREKVPHIFGLCGHGDVGLPDALHDRTESIRTISTRHEQTAGHMADAYFRVAYRPGATLTSCGPGSASFPIALACALVDSSAFLAGTASIPTSRFNRAAFRETYRHFQADFPSVIGQCVKRSWQPTRPDMPPTALRQAFATSTDSPHPRRHRRREDRPQLPGASGRRRRRADGIRVERAAGDLAGAPEHAIKAHAPFVLDVHVDRDIRPPGVGTWELPPLPYGQPVVGKRRLPREEE